ncbi:DUF6319 family protein [Nakamurella sp. GG22]
MPPRRRAAAPPPIDVEAVRSKLAEGKIVRVGITRSAQFPEGGTGRIRHVGNPDVDGDEYVQVELSLNGTRDILPFTPADLTPAMRGRPPAQFPVTPARSTTARPAPAPAPASAPRPPTAEHADRAGAGMERPPSDEPTVPAPAVRPAAAADSAREPARPAPVERNAPRATVPVPKTRPTKGARRTPPVSITVATTSSEPVEWRIEARIGTKVAVRSAVVSPARVWEFVRLLDNDALSQAVGAILDEQRTAAQARADALAAELAQVRAELDALPEARR